MNIADDLVKAYNDGYQQGKKDAVVRGEWVRVDESQALLSVEWKCSQCGQEIRVDGILTAIGAGWKYCPNCGAKMEDKL